MNNITEVGDELKLKILSKDIPKEWIEIFNANAKKYFPDVTILSYNFINVTRSNKVNISGVTEVGDVQIGDIACYGSNGVDELDIDDASRWNQAIHNVSDMKMTATSISISKSTSESDSRSLGVSANLSGGESTFRMGLSTNVNFTHSTSLSNSISKTYMHTDMRMENSMIPIPKNGIIYNVEAKIPVKLKSAKLGFEYIADLIDITSDKKLDPDKIIPDTTLKYSSDAEIEQTVNCFILFMNTDISKIQAKLQEIIFGKAI